MLRVSRSLFIVVISASLVCSPLFALRAGASEPLCFGWAYTPADTAYT